MRILAAHVVADLGPRYGRHGRFGHPGLIVFGLLVLGGIVALAIVLLRDRRRPSVPTSAPLAGGGWSPATSAETILSERFARGEVSVEDFVTARSALRGEWVPPRPTPDPPAG